MKNLTLSVDERVLKEARRAALNRDTTVNAMVREFLDSVTTQDRKREKARRQILAMIGTFDCKIGRLPGREERNARH